MVNPRDREAGATLGEELGMLRYRQNWTQEEAALKVGVTSRSIKEWESGRSKPSVRNLQKLIAAYLLAGAFPAGREREESANLWELAQMSVSLDEIWFGELRKVYQSSLSAPVEPATGADGQHSVESSEQPPSPDFPSDDVVTDAREHFVDGEQWLGEQNRRRMLMRMHSFWIKGVLEKPMHRAIVSAPTLLESPDAVAHPWHIALPELRPAASLLPANTSAIHVYDNSNGTLLVLGEPGSGKTTLLLELTRTLLERARRDEQQPIPVIFTLSSWATQQLPLAQWMIDELITKYQVPLALAQTWIADDKLLLLLDGLDEVDVYCRESCVQAINAYRHEHGFVPIVVCSRKNEYFSLPTRLILDNAIVIQSLTRQEVDDCLMNLGEQALAVRAAMDHDPTLYELATTPLILQVLLQTYQEASPDTFKVSTTLQMKLTHVFEAYVQRMFSRRSHSTHYTQPQTAHWLTELARQMKRQNQSIFYIEHMQADWLPKGSLSRTYERLGIQFPAILLGVLVNLIINNVFGTSDIADTLLFAVIGGIIGYLLGSKPPQTVKHTYKNVWQRICTRGLFCGLLIALSVGLAFRLYIGPLQGYGQVEWLHDWLVYSISFGLGGVLLGGVLVGSSSVISSPPGEASSWYSLLRGFIRDGYMKNVLWVSITLGVCSWFGDILSSPPLGQHMDPLPDAISNAVVFGLTTSMTSIVLTEMKRTIQPVEDVIWTWRAFGNVEHLRKAGMVGIVVALALGLGYSVQGGMSIGIVIALTYGLGASVIYWTLLGSLSSVASTMMSPQDRMVPNEGIRRSARNSLFYGLLAGCTSGLISFMLILLSSILIPEQYLLISPGLHAGLITALAFGLLVGVSTGLAMSLLRGGTACLRHGVLRLLLWSSGAIPWNYAHFLDFATERILLHKVGGGYIFIHRLLLEYFAELEA